MNRTIPIASVRQERSAIAEGVSPYLIDKPFIIPKKRYYDSEFYEQERQSLWMRSWQAACRVEELPEVGDYTEYKIAERSLLIIRSSATTIHAMSNSCRHRGRALLEGSGSLRGKKIICGFHGWRWNLDGSNDYVYGRHGFDPSMVRPEDIGLAQAKVAIWAGFVWINFDANAEPFEDFIAPVKALVDPHGVDRMQVLWWQSAVMEANWKLPLEAFIEGYHIRYTHPQSNFGQDINPDYAEYKVLGRGHSLFMESENFHEHRDDAKSGLTPGQVMLKRWKGIQRTFDAIVTQRDVVLMEGIANRAIPEGSSIEAEHLRAFREHCEGAGIIPPDLGQETVRRNAAVFTLFPNLVVVPWFGNAWIGRTRPIGPERCYFDMWSVTLQPEGKPAKRPVHKGYFPPSNKDAWLLVPQQDFGNVEPQQRAMHSFGADHIRLSNKWEVNINELHREIDDYLVGTR